MCFQETYHEERYKDYHPRGMNGTAAGEIRAMKSSTVRCPSCERAVSTSRAVLPAMEVVVASLNGPEYLEKVLQTARPYFHNLSIEVMPMKQRDYERLMRNANVSCASSLSVITTFG